MKCPHCDQEFEPPLSMIDDDGEVVEDGDKIQFSYGIPPVRVIGRVVTIKGALWVLTPGHNPAESPMATLREHVELFYKVLP